MARPKKAINETRVSLLAANMCTMAEIAADQNCSVDTLERRFAEVIKRGHELAKLSLRAKQFQVATGRPGRPAVYLRKFQDEDGKQSGDLVLNPKGEPILILAETPEVKPSIPMLIWLGKQHLGQADTFKWEEGDGFEFVKNR